MAPLTALLLVPHLAWGTVAFDPGQPEETFTGQETWTQDGGVQLWSAIERHRDPDPALFHAEEFNWAMAWPQSADWAPWVATCFGTAQPTSDSFLLHVGLHEPRASGTPILLVPGAGDNGSRAFVTFAAHMDALGRPVYALTFAHPHGDLFMQAEVVADAVGRIRARTGAAQVDVVAHSKGGIAAAMYAANHGAARWGDAGYAAEGTRYRGDVRRLVLVATPLGGLDTAFRWPANNLAGLDAEAAVAPVSWSTWYPYGPAAPAFATDLSRQDLLPEDGDLFPGQRQLLARQEAALPGTLAWLGVYALQPDWWTTYEGGYGYQSWSAGIDEAVAQAADPALGSLLGQIQASGVDPGIEIALLSGDNPLLPTGWEAWWATWFDQAWLDMATASADTWGLLLAAAAEAGALSTEVAPGDLQGLAAGKLVLGEISGPSDGLLFAASARRQETLTGRGAYVRWDHVAHLSHLDLLYASPVTGELMMEAAAVDPVEDGWMADLGQRYIDEDTIGWLETVLADAAEPDDTGSPDDTAGGDTGEPADTGDDTGAPLDGQPRGGGCGCHGARSTPLPFLWLLLALLIRRKRPNTTC
ncbi:MAG: hypothetical protein ABIO70_30440 [Pseudomonadota bacterium]